MLSPYRPVLAPGCRQGVRRAAFLALGVTCPPRLKIRERVNYGTIPSVGAGFAPARSPAHRRRVRRPGRLLVVWDDLSHPPTATGTASPWRSSIPS
jgi:hypothetical protein